MSRHRLPSARPDRDVELVAPVIAAPAGPAARTTTIRPVRRPAAVPAPREAPESRGRHRLAPTPAASGPSQQAETADPAAPPTPASRPSRQADIADPTAPPTPASRPSQQGETADPTGRSEATTGRSAASRARADAPAGRHRARSAESDAPEDGGVGDAVAGDAGASTVATGRSRHRAADVPAPRRTRTSVLRTGASPDVSSTDVTGSDVAASALGTASLFDKPATPAPAPAPAPASRRAARTQPRPPGRRHRAGGGATRRRGALLAVAVTAGLVALPTVSSAAVDQCRWQQAARALFVALDGNTDAQSTALRQALTQAGVGSQLPAACRDQRTSQAAAPATSAPTSAARATTSASRPTSTKATAPTSKTAPKPAPAPQAAAPAATGSGQTAADAHGWGAPVKTDDFSNGLGQWGVYNGPGHGGNGRRTPDAAKVAGGLLTITGDSQGNSAGMAWGDGQKYGRWEARVRSTAGDESYHPVMLLWPDAENWPVGGEVDWMEISSADRQDSDTFLHYGSSNNQVSGNVKVDATQWHNWAVEWTPQGITTYLDGKEWWSTKNTSILPPGPMHMTIQLDYFGGGNPKTSQMQVDWVKQYKL